MDALTILAHDLAYESARSDIECYSKFRPCVSGMWWQLDDRDPDHAEIVARAVRYLDARKLLRRHPEHPDWVQIEDAIRLVALT